MSAELGLWEDTQFLVIWVISIIMMTFSQNINIKEINCYVKTVLESADPQGGYLFSPAEGRVFHSAHGGVHISNTDFHSLDTDLF